MKTVVVTGASSGIGEATARLFAKEGWDVVIGARRTDRIEALAQEIGARSHTLDVTSLDSVREFCAAIDACNVLVNNAGGAFGQETLAEADEQKWRDMYDTNVMGTMFMTRELLPQLIQSGDGHVINITSIAGHVAYPGGAGYNAAKFAERGITEGLRKELLGQPVRVTEIAPGMVETEFAIVRNEGDRARADATYQGMTPLVAEDIAECVMWCATRPSHVNIDTMQVMPLDQTVGTFSVNRKTT